MKQRTIKISGVRPQWLDSSNSVFEKAGSVQWLEEQAKRFAPSTRERFIWALAVLAKEFGDHYLDAIETAQVRRWRDKSAGEYAAASVNGCLRVLRQVVDTAVDDGIIPFNPTRAVSLCRKGGRGGAAVGL